MSRGGKKLQRPGKQAGTLGFVELLASERGFQAKTVPETAQPLSKKRQASGFAGSIGVSQLLTSKPCLRGSGSSAAKLFF